MHHAADASKRRTPEADAPRVASMSLLSRLRWAALGTLLVGRALETLRASGASARHRTAIMPIPPPLNCSRSPDQHGWMICGFVGRCVLAAMMLWASDAPAAYFKVAETLRPVESYDAYVIAVNDPANIAHARDLIARGPAAERTIVVARIKKGSDIVNRNLAAPGWPPWSWHIVGEPQFADFTIEILDGTPTTVEADVDWWIRNTGGAIGFWGYTIVAEVQIEELVAPATVVVVEFYNEQLDHFFLTADTREIGDLDSGVHAGWRRTGLSFRGYPEATHGAEPVCRFYIPPPRGDSHFLSALAHECTRVLELIATDPNYSGYVHESASVFFLNTPDTVTGRCPYGTRPIFRLWNQRRDSNHRYTDDARVVQEMIARGYLPEGYGSDPAAMCAPDLPMN